jgi:hypothetical protein
MLSMGCMLGDLHVVDVVHGLGAGVGGAVDGVTEHGELGHDLLLPLLHLTLRLQVHAPLGHTTAHRRYLLCGQSLNCMSYSHN